MLQFRSLSSPSFKASEISPAPCAPGCDTRQLLSRDKVERRIAYLVLFVGKHQESGIFQLVLVQHRLQLVRRDL
jgi:hypothetical protein